MLKFVPYDTSDGRGQKRAASQRACESCRKRKKRCQHADGSISPRIPSRQFQLGPSPRAVPNTTQHEALTGREDIAASAIPSELAGEGRHHETLDDVEPSIALTSLDCSDAAHSAAPITHSSNACESDPSEDESRFIGHLNPEGTFLAISSPALTTGSGETHEVGVWLSDRGRRGKRKRHATLPMRKPQSSAIYCPNPMISTILLPHLEESCLSLLPDTSALEALCAIYFDQIHPLFPVADKKDLEALPAQSPSRIALSQVICLLASSSPVAKPLLSLPVNGQREVLERGSFAHELSLAVRTSINLGLVKDKLTLCQICALLSMSMQLAEDRHLSADLCARAVAYGQTLGLHLPAQSDREDAQVLSRVFCCIWALDRLNAAFHGRPITMHERDFGRDLEMSIKSQEGCFQLFLRTTLLLDKVVDLYRPSVHELELNTEPEIPDIESVVHDADALRVRHNLLATIETFYHAVAILSCRSQSSEDRRSPSYVRQSLSASRVMTMVAEDADGQLSPLPIVPYAVSLALRFYYREFRFTKVSLFRARAQKQLVIGCGILRRLGEAYVVAAGIARLVEQTLNETDKVYSSLVQSQEPGRSRIANEAPETISSTDAPSAGDDTTAQIGAIDWSLWDNMPDFDVFQHFDPSFNLEAVDAALAYDTQPMFSII